MAKAMSTRRAHAEPFIVSAEAACPVETLGSGTAFGDNLIPATLGFRKGGAPLVPQLYQRLSREVTADVGAIDQQLVQTKGASAVKVVGRQREASFETVLSLVT
jgi:hypothetical protein